MSFRDHFSGRAHLYARYRPDYPGKLFEWIASLVLRHDAAWDCATGNGQAAVGLSGHFERVIATDASEKQIALAEPHGGIEYRVARAEESGLEERSIDVVTVAQAIHWLDHSSFYPEVRRVLRPDGALVVWGYGDPVLDDPALDRIVHDYNRGTVEEYWMPERDLILLGLRTIPFPFREIECPSFILQRDWTLEQLSGYLRTWSATARYAAVLGADPVLPVEAALAEPWGPRAHRIEWPLYIRAGYLQ